MKTRYETTCRRVWWPGSAGALFCLLIIGLGACAPKSASDAATGGSGASDSAGGSANTSQVVASGEVENAGEWLVDNRQGVKDGATAVHPPPLVAGDKRSFSYDCDGASHTQFRFSGYYPGGVGTVEIAVDGEFWEQLGFPNNGAWHERILNVPGGVHTYTFTASADQNTAPMVVLDSFSCSYSAPAPGANGYVDYDRGFVPVETGGGWLTDNIRGAVGETAIHPPWMSAGDESAMTFDCNGDAHTQFSFSGYYPGGVGTLEIAVDGEFWEQLGFPNNGAWHERILNVQEGPHTYTFTARTEQDTPPMVVLDSFSCKHTAPVPGVNGRVDYDRGFVPVETGGGWLTDNIRGAVGEAAIHPPWLKAGETSQMTFDCNGDEHTQFRFSGYYPGGVGTVEFAIDGKVSDSLSFPNNGAWHERIFEVGRGTHEYTFIAQTEQDTSPMVVLDSFACQ